MQCVTHLPRQHQKDIKHNIMKEHLLHFFPFLRTDFRKLEESELQSEETFKELFPNDVVELWKLRTIYVYQQPEFKTFVVSGEQVKTAQTLDRKIIKNAKV